MYEPENLREAMKALIEYNTAGISKIIEDSGKEREARIGDLQDLNLDVIYTMCELLGMSDLLKFK